MTIDTTLFKPDAISEETRAFNVKMRAFNAAMPDTWSYTPAQVRAARREGNGLFPVEPFDPHAETRRVHALGLDVPVRILRPANGTARGTYLHLHGGGWTLGSADSQDVRLRQICETCQLDVVSVDYRLAPEHPYPAGPDDCEAAAFWLVEGVHDLATDVVTIGGESAGAHLSVVTMLRLRKRMGNVPFHGANLTAGAYDMGGSPSVHLWDRAKLILEPRDVRMFRACFLPNTSDYRLPDISPFYADLTGMPPALFEIGTEDILLDDSVTMAARWQAANGNARLEVTPGGCHVFQAFFDTLTIAKESCDRIDAFLTDPAA